MSAACLQGYHYPVCRPDGHHPCDCPCHDVRDLHYATAYSTKDEGLCSAMGVVAGAMYELADALDRSRGATKWPQR